MPVGGFLPSDVEVMMRDFGVTVSGVGVTAGTRGLYEKGYVDALTGARTGVMPAVVRLRVPSGKITSTVKQGSALTVDGVSFKLARDIERGVGDGAFDDLLLTQVT